MLVFHIVTCVNGNKSGLIEARYLLSYLLGSLRLVFLPVEIIFSFMSD
jgi:hypothetical protein